MPFHSFDSRPKFLPFCVATGAFALLLAGCSPVAAGSTASLVTNTAGSAQPRVLFVSPQDGASVSSPVHVQMGAENFVVEPAGEVRTGAGHLHIMVDAECIAPGQGIPKDDSHLHYGKAQTEAELVLTPGAHTLCLQAADGSHVAMDGQGMTQTIGITVE